MRRILALLVAAASTLAAFAEEPKIGPHQDLTYFLDKRGIKQSIQTLDDWKIRRGQILANMQLVMGKLPGDEKRVPLDVKIEEEVKLDGGLVRRKLSFQSEPNDRVAAYLFLPKAEGKSPAMLCLHQTVPIGKSEPAGLGKRSTLQYALELAERGYVTLAPDYPSFGEHDFKFDEPKFGYASGTMKAIWDNIRAIDLLQSLPEVDGERIGAIGHSLGGHNSMFTAAFDERIKAVVSSCGFTRFHKYYEGKLKGWTSDRYMPLITTKYHENPDEMPFDFPEIVASFAPRAFLAMSPEKDHNFEVSGVRDCLAAAAPIYKLYGKPENLTALYPPGGHDFFDEPRMKSYEFLDQHLKPKK